jgi:hypothetical protein
MRQLHRVTNPRVINGRVQRRNRTDLSPCFRTPRPYPLVERHKPGFGYRHVLRQADVAAFLHLLPDWAQLAQGLNAVVLASGEFNCDGWHVPGVVAVCAWGWRPWREVSVRWYAEHWALLERLDVPCEQVEDGYVVCKFEEPSIRSYQLLHVLLHELGHHHDRMTTRSRKRTGRGEGYAEQYAWRYEALIWDQYLNQFGLY